MRPIKPEGWPEHRITMFAKNQPEYIPLPAARLGDQNRTVLTVWELDWKERLAILLGAPLRISMLTFGHPLTPIKPHIGEDEFTKECREAYEEEETDEEVPF